MESHNKIVRTAKRLLMATNEDLDPATAGSLALDGLKRQLNRAVFFGLSPGGHTRLPKIPAPFCEEPDSDKYCDFEAKFRTITGECNNMM